MTGERKICAAVVAQAVGTVSTKNAQGRLVPLYEPEDEAQLHARVGRALRAAERRVLADYDDMPINEYVRGGQTVEERTRQLAVLRLPKRVRAAYKQLLRVYSDRAWLEDPDCSATWMAGAGLSHQAFTDGLRARGVLPPRD